MFYPAQPEALRHALREAFVQARAGEAWRPKALIAPHAGYI
jgi:AmmeMemoRadiSam system protein B